MKPIDEYINKVICNDSEKVLKDIPDNSIDSIVTDPPYALSSITKARPGLINYIRKDTAKNDNPFASSQMKKGFMGKEWDVLPSIDLWKECLRVLKHGAFAFIMTTPRQDSLCQILMDLTQAGFNMGFSSIYYAYACLSSDTEILTKDGWKDWEHLHKSNKDDKILIYDTINKLYKWEIPSRWNIYKIKDTCYKIKSNNTEQIITKNHRIAIEYNGKILFKTVEEIEKEGLENVIRIPYLENMQMLPKSIFNSIFLFKKWKRWKILFDKLQTKNKYLQIFISKWKAYSSNVRKTKTKAKRSYDGRKKLGLERWYNLFQNTWKLYRSQIYKMSKKIFNYGTQRWLCYGTSNISSTGNWQTFIKNRGSSSQRWQSIKQFIKKFNIIFKQYISQKIRIRTKHKTTLAKITKEWYEGIVYCPTVSTGCIIARRKNKIFLTGNSGFPKAHNISKAIDKKMGVEREKIKSPATAKNSPDYGKYNGEIDNNIPITEKAKEFDGAYGGFQPKPAVEIILVVQKPLSEKTFVGQALKNGKGCTYLDDCRIPYKNDNDNKNVENKQSKNPTEKKGYFVEGIATYNNQGRFPANLLVSDDVLNSNEYNTHPAGNIRKSKFNDYNATSYKMGLHEHNPNYYSDEKDKSSFSRYFDLDSWAVNKGVKDTFPFLICPKAAKSEKNRGCKNIEGNQHKTGSRTYDDVCANCGKKLVGDSPYRCECDNKVTQKRITKGNFHPTAKPVKLMSYLITLGSRPDDIILDPFAGSGSTAIACIKAGRKYIMIDKEKEYVEIAKNRLEAVKEDVSLISAVEKENEDKQLELAI